MRLTVVSLGIVLGAGAVWASASTGCATDRGTLVDGGGGDSPAAGPVENTLDLCKNGKDDDGDGFKDCFDKDCYSSKDKTGPGAAYCKGSEATEDTVAKCSDGIDNDGNGYIDCADFSCTKINPLCEVTDALCSDGIDNDGNGYKDCNDNECAKNPSVTVCGDGGVIKPADAGAENTDALCSDGLDNDGDGHKDCDDFDCSKNPNVTVCKDAGKPDSGKPADAGSENTDILCSDGIDNDGDGYVDCNDFDCSKNPSVTVCKDGGTTDAATDANAADATLDATAVDAGTGG